MVPEYSHQTIRLMVYGFAGKPTRLKTAVVFLYYKTTVLSNLNF
jgi:hypothetical protein